MRDVIYEVRFPNNLDPDFVQRFSNKTEACDYAYDFPDAEVYMLTLGKVINEIPDEVILGLAKLWDLKIMPGVIKEK